MGEKPKAILTYKGRPLVRKDKTICFGNVTDKYVLILTILETKAEKGLDVASRVLVQLQNTDENVSSTDRVVKSTEKNSLYEAFDIGEIWLDRLLADSVVN
jgi:hypothetical protein